MLNFVAFQTQLASIMEVLAKAAVAEITKLVDESSTGLRLEMSRSQYENEALRRKLKVMESKLVLVRGCTESKEARKNSLKCSGSLHGQIRICNGIDKDGVFEGEWGSKQWRDGEVSVVEEDMYLQSIILTEEPSDMEKGVSASLVIKDKGHKVDWMNGNHEEGQMISGETGPSDCHATEQRSPFEQQLNESVCDKRLQSAACPEEEDTLVIPLEGLELHRITECEAAHWYISLSTCQRRG
ncbi:hypothetical protein AGOR_G00156640 [Albula goreensis]|uniref:Uncharacterized protein n=1 Tax=Albula goreensis TaxID=1534307 RepID=A0A8T3D413_9TELE|nr:hypothetical protein AGOR_G00156640 [Albula goreensis]